jgi:hypothetical protein
VGISRLRRLRLMRLIWIFPMFDQGKIIEPAEPDNQAETTKEARWNALIGLATGLGASDEEAAEKSYKVFEMAGAIAGIDLDQDPEHMKRRVVDMIMEVGAWFLPKNEKGILPNKENEFQFQIGLRALKLVKGPLDSPAFNGLDTAIRIWTFGKGKALFDTSVDKGD